MPGTFTPETRQQLLAQLHQALEAHTIQTLRAAARLWGWPLRGIAKADIVGQMAGYLTDRARMADDIMTLPEEARELLGWINALNPAGDPKKVLQQVLALTSDRRQTQKATGELIANLQERCLVFVDVTNRYIVPGIFLEWLAPLAAPALRHSGPPLTGLPFSLATFNQHVQQLLVNIDLDRPTLAVNTAGQAAAYSPMERLSGPLAARPGLLGPETLARWDYRTPNERDLASFLLDQLLNAGLCLTDQSAGSPRLKPVQAASKTWETLLPLDRLLRLRQTWLTVDPQRNVGLRSTWNELDLALRSVRSFTLRSSYYWGAAEPLYASIALLRVWLMKLVGNLAIDVWYSVDQLCRLIYQIRRDLFALSLSPGTWRWHSDKTPLDPNQMDYETWQATYGQVIEAWLSGPASWLLLVQVGYEKGRPIAFRLLDQIPAGDALALPADAIRFLSETEAVLRNTWQTGGLRQLLRRIAVETARSREATTYRLDVATFRDTLQAGVKADQLAADFAAADFPLPPATRARLQAWQDRAGRHQLYDQVAVIEFSDDMGPEEARAIAGLGIGQFYQASPRCLVVLNPNAAPEIINELRRRGYTPQVTP